jgi:hypothetical protein
MTRPGCDDNGEGVMKKTRAGRRVPRVTTDGATHSRDAGRSFPIVGIGASAGGLEAFSALLKRLPLDTGMGFVLVQHLDPEHDSALTQLLGRATSLPVHEVTNNLHVEPHHVHVIPPNTNLSIAAGVLRLHPRPKTRAPHRSIDFFFEALAQDQHERAIGVILSGTATDGTLGLEAIKAEGGITFAQNVMRDPPFSRMDIISCRNLLIYLESGVQKRVFPVFHYALKPGGFLCLGASESISGFTELFEPIDRKHKIYVVRPPYRTTSPRGTGKGSRQCRKSRGVHFSGRPARS